MKRRIITITGLPGSGKSSTAKGVAAVLGYDHFSSGDLFRQMATARGLSIEGINFAAETQKEIDHEVDEVLIRMGKEKNDLVIDSRMAFHWMPDSFKVFLDLDLRTAAERTFAHIQKEGRESQAGSSMEEVYENTVNRRKSEIKRYMALYDTNLDDKSPFDLVIDTANYDLQQVIDMVVAAYKKWLTEFKSKPT